MPIDTNLDQSPYWDDFDPAKNDNRVLFKPGVAVQTRELNQTQSIARDQLEQLADSVYKPGAIVEGCNFNFLTPYPYVKILDSQVNGIQAIPAAYVGLRASNPSGVVATIVNSTDGYESAPPDLKTLYVQYIGSETFAPSDVLTIESGNSCIFSVSIVDSGIAFSNSDVLVLTPDVVVNVTSGTFANGAYVTFPSLGSNLQITNVDSTSLASAGQIILELTPRDVDLANGQVNSLAWAVASNTSIRNAANTAVGTVVATLGSNASGSIVTDASGRVAQVLIQSYGAGYTSPPTARMRSVNNATGLAALELTALNYLVQVQVANSDSVGDGYAVRVSEGKIYQKGQFLRVTPQTVIVSKYDVTPNDVSVGFLSAESVVDYEVDTSLLDNALGTLNYTAPGADRLRLTPTLTLANGDFSSPDFLTICAWSEGRPFSQDQPDALSRVGDAIARATRDADGDFVIAPFAVTTRSPANAAFEGNTFTIAVSPGTAYVGGYKIETTSMFTVDDAKGLDVESDPGVSIPLQYGLYARVKECGGVFQFNTGDLVNLYDTAKTYLTNVAASSSGNLAPAGNLVGNARVRSMLLESGVPGTPGAVYDLYMFSLQMAPGKSFSGVRSIAYGANAGIADVALELDPATAANVAILHGFANNGLLFDSGCESLLLASNAYYDFRTIDSTLSFANTGLISKSLSGHADWTHAAGPGVLSNESMLDLYVVPTGNTLQYYANVGGTVSANMTTPTLVGSSTSFVTDLAPGDWLLLYSNSTVRDTRRIASIGNNTTATLDANCAVTASGMAAFRVFPKGVPIPFGARAGLSGNVDGTGQLLTLSLGGTLDGTSTVNAAMAFDVRVSGGDAGAKQASRDQLVKISTANNAGGSSGPWCLGVPDVVRLDGVFWGSNSQNANTAGRDVTSSFYVDNGQTLDYLDLAHLYLRPGAAWRPGAADWLLVQFDYLTAATPGWYCSSSYLGSNVAMITATDSLALANLGSSIATLEVPELYDARGDEYDLLRYLDFRPSAANTVTTTTSAATAPVNPAYALSFGNTANPANDREFPNPTSTMIADIEQYEGRVDSVFVSGSADSIFVVRGKPDVSPAKRHPPAAPRGSMLLTNIDVPPYPGVPQYPSARLREILATSVSSESFLLAGRPASHSLVVDAPLRAQPRVYTMSDIGNIDRRLAAVEDESALSALEQQVASTQVPSSLDPAVNRFQYGFFADGFDDVSLQDRANPAYSAMVMQSALWPSAFGWAMQPSSNAHLVQRPYANWPIVTQGLATGPAIVVVANTANTANTPPPLPPAIVNVAVVHVLTVPNTAPVFFNQTGVVESLTTNLAQYAGSVIISQSGTGPFLVKGGPFQLSDVDFPAETVSTILVQGTGLLPSTEYQVTNGQLSVVNTITGAVGTTIWTDASGALVFTMTTGALPYGYTDFTDDPGAIDPLVINVAASTSSTLVLTLAVTANANVAGIVSVTNSYTTHLFLGT